MTAPRLASSFKARRRRAPASISYLPLAVFRPVRFCNRPNAAILAQSSSIPASLAKRRTLSLEGASERSGSISRSSALAVAGAVFVSHGRKAFLAAARGLAVFLAGSFLAVIFLSPNLIEVFGMRRAKRSARQGFKRRTSPSDRE